MLQSDSTFNLKSFPNMYWLRECIGLLERLSSAKLEKLLKANGCKFEIKFLSNFILWMAELLLKQYSWKTPIALNPTSRCFMVHDAQAK